jgi:hypothetical protein
VFPSYRWSSCRTTKQSEVCKGNWIAPRERQLWHQGINGETVFNLLWAAYKVVSEVTKYAHEGTRQDRQEPDCDGCV